MAATAISFRLQIDVLCTWYDSAVDAAQAVRAVRAAKYAMVYVFPSFLSMQLFFILYLWVQTSKQLGSNEDLAKS